MKEFNNEFSIGRGFVLSFRYRFSNFTTGGDAGRGIARISFVACPMYMKNAQIIDTFLATAPSTFHTLKRKMIESI
jgi:hypothetical protein